MSSELGGSATARELVALGVLLALSLAPVVWIAVLGG